MKKILLFILKVNYLKKVLNVTKIKTNPKEIKNVPRTAPVTVLMPPSISIPSVRKT